jgi:hypothetical protein
MVGKLSSSSPWFGAMAVLSLYIAPAHADPAQTLASALAECGAANVTPPASSSASDVSKSEDRRVQNLWSGELARNLSCRLDAYHRGLEHRLSALPAELIAARDAYNHDVDILNAIVPAECATRYDGCGITSSMSLNPPALQAVLDHAPHEDQPEYARMLAACGSLNLTPPTFPDGRTASQNDMVRTNHDFEIWALEARRVLACRRPIVSQAAHGDVRASAAQILSSSHDFDRDAGQFSGVIERWNNETRLYNTIHSRQD